MTLPFDQMVHGLSIPEVNEYVRYRSLVHYKVSFVSTLVKPQIRQSSQQQTLQRKRRRSKYSEIPFVPEISNSSLRSAVLSEMTQIPLNIVPDISGRVSLNELKEQYPNLISLS